MGMKNTKNIKCINLKRNDIFKDTVIPPLDYQLYLLNTQASSYSGGFEIISDTTSTKFTAKANIGACGANSIILLHKYHIPANWLDFVSLPTNLLITTICVDDDGNIVGQETAPIYTIDFSTDTKVKIKFGRFQSGTNFTVKCDTIEYCVFDLIYSGSSTPSATNNLMYANTVNNIKVNYLSNEITDTFWSLDSSSTISNYVQSAYDSNDDTNYVIEYTSSTVVYRSGSSYTLKYGGSNIYGFERDVDEQNGITIANDMVLMLKKTDTLVSMYLAKYNSGTDSYDVTLKTHSTDYTSEGFVFNDGFLKPNTPTTSDSNFTNAILILCWERDLGSTSDYYFERWNYTISGGTIVDPSSHYSGMEINKTYDMVYSALACSNTHYFVALYNHTLTDSTTIYTYRLSNNALVSTKTFNGYTPRISPLYGSNYIYRLDGHTIATGAHSYNIYADNKCYTNDNILIYSATSGFGEYRPHIITSRYDTTTEYVYVYINAPILYTGIYYKFNSTNTYTSENIVMSKLYYHNVAVYEDKVICMTYADAKDTWVRNTTANYSAYAFKLFALASGATFNNIHIQPYDGYTTDDLWHVAIYGYGATPTANSMTLTNAKIAADTLSICGADNSKSTNLFLEQVEDVTTAISSTNYSPLIFYYSQYKPSLTCSVVSGATIKSYGHFTYIPENTYVFEWFSFPYDNVNALTYNDFSVEMTQSIETTTGYLRNIKATGYNLQFKDNWYVQDAVKYFDYDDYMIVLREDLNRTLNGKYVVNSKLYDSDDNLVSFRSDENFYIQLQDGRVIAYYDDTFMSTMMGIVPDESTTTTDATVLSVFQVLRPPTSTSFRNMYNFDDSPLEASIQYIDTTREYVVRS